MSILDTNQDISLTLQFCVDDIQIAAQPRTLKELGISSKNELDKLLIPELSNIPIDDCFDKTGCDGLDEYIVTIFDKHWPGVCIVSETPFVYPAKMGWSRTDVSIYKNGQNFSKMVIRCHATEPHLFNTCVYGCPIRFE